MQHKILHRINQDRFYVEDAIFYIPENVEEARLVGYPIVREQVPIADSGSIPEPEELQQMRSRLETLEAIPGEDRTVQFAIAELRDRIEKASAQFEQDKLSQLFEIRESFQIPPIPSDCIESPLTGSFFKAKWTGSKWTEGLSKKEIEEMSKPIADWNKLQESLRGTDLFAKAMGTVNTNAWALLLTTLAVVRNWDDLKFAIAGVRVGLPEDFSESELQRINQILSDCGFESI